MSINIPKLEKAGCLKIVRRVRNSCAIARGSDSNWLKLENKGQYFFFDTMMVQNILGNVYKLTQTIKSRMSKNSETCQKLVCYREGSCIELGET